ncbi:hypothetical protein GRI58_01840 [Porphyrobacter algicida]|uniref:DUF3298 domain-containing protein n=1 Tax=Qipengyuania algicida TaxID=1836209 RepID=A0A845AAX0_9SPHN|nr:hypothetical protein [Qipengyuania algicida]MXP27562.1 hypothetical protein [Qipengyuania algicida]
MRVFTRIICGLLVLSSLPSCSAPEAKEPDESQIVTEYNRKAADFPKPVCEPGAKVRQPRILDASPQYFPLTLLKPTIACPAEAQCRGQMVALQYDWFSGMLRAAYEPSFTQKRHEEGDRYNAHYRVMVLPTFEHPIIVRFDIGPQGGKLVASLLSGAGGYQPGKVIRRVDRAITAAELAKLKGLVSQNELRNLPTSICWGGLDGKETVFEFLDASGYKVMHRWEVARPLAKLESFALSLTGWDDLHAT